MEPWGALEETCLSFGRRVTIIDNLFSFTKHGDKAESYDACFGNFGVGKTCLMYVCKR